MKHLKLKFNAFILFLSFILSISIAAQENKILFAKKVPIKMESKSSYSFYVGYIVDKDSDIAIDFSGGPTKSWSGKTVQVKKGKGIFNFKLGMNENPQIGKNYKLVASIRERNGGWETTKTAHVISNIEIVKKASKIIDDANFGQATLHTLPSTTNIPFNIDFRASTERLIQVTLWNGSKWIASSGKVKVPKGEGTARINLKTPQLALGNKYRYVLEFGSGDNFPKEHMMSEEISGITVTKAKETEKVITLKDLRKNSINIKLKEGTNILEIPGEGTYQFLRILALNGKLVKEVTNTNSTDVSLLQKGAYYVITNKDKFYRFLKY